MFRFCIPFLVLFGYTDPSVRVGTVSLFPPLERLGASAQGDAIRARIAERGAQLIQELEIRGVTVTAVFKSAATVVVKGTPSTLESLERQLPTILIPQLEAEFGDLFENASILIEDPRKPTLRAARR